MTNEIEFKKIFLIIANKKKLIIFITLIFTLMSFVYSLVLPNIYSSFALLMPSEKKDSPLFNMGNYSTIAGIAGVDIANSDTAKSVEAIKRIESYEFFSKLFVPNIDFKDLVAPKKWDSKTKTLSYKEHVLDSESQKISIQEAYVIYRDMLTITEDKKSSFVTIRISHPSPEISKAWVDLIVSKINSSMQSSDRKAIEKSMKFLEEESKSTNIQSIRESISNILESEMQKLMLLTANDEYVFKIIDPPIVPEKKSEPKRLIIIVIGIFSGIFVSVTISLLTHKEESIN